MEHPTVDFRQVHDRLFLCKTCTEGVSKDLGCQTVSEVPKVFWDVLVEIAYKELKELVRCDGFSEEGEFETKCHNVVCEHALHHCYLEDMDFCNACAAQYDNYLRQNTEEFEQSYFQQNNEQQ